MPHAMTRRGLMRSFISIPLLPCMAAATSRVLSDGLPKNASAPSPQSEVFIGYNTPVYSSLNAEQTRWVSTREPSGDLVYYQTSPLIGGGKPSFSSLTANV